MEKLFSLNLVGANWRLDGDFVSLIASNIDVSVFLFGQIDGMRSNYGDETRQPSRKLLSKLLLEKGASAVMLLEGDFLLIFVRRDAIEIVPDAFANLTAFYRIEQEQVIFYRPDGSEIERDRSLFSARLVEVKGYSFLTETPYTGVVRMLPLESITFSDSEIVRQAILDPSARYFDDLSFEIFRSILERRLAWCFGGDDSHPVIAFSGGCDSSILALYARKLGRVPRLVTARFLSAGRDPASRWTDRARKFARKYSFDLEIGSWELHKCPPEGRDLHKVRWLMPFSHHQAEIVLNLARCCANIAGNKRATVFNGQNADTICGLGPTEEFYPSLRGIASGLKGVLSRFILYLSFKLVPEKRTELSNGFSTFSGVVGFLIAFNLTSLSYLAWLTTKRWTKLFPEHSLNEIGRRIRCDIDETYSGFSTKQLVHIWKLTHFLQGGDNKVVAVSQSVVGGKAVMPYKSLDLFLFFFQSKWNMRDIIIGKRFLRRYLRELSSDYLISQKVRSR